MQAPALSPSAPSRTVTKQSLSAYIQERIIECNGPQLPCDRAEEILNGFWDRFGVEAGMAICAQVFDVRNGMWHNAPVTVLRFQEGQDQFFANPLLEEALARP